MTTTGAMAFAAVMQSSSHEAPVSSASSFPLANSRSTERGTQSRNRSR